MNLEQRATIAMREICRIMAARDKLLYLLAHPQESNQPREQQPQGQRPGGHKQEQEHDNER